MIVDGQEIPYSKWSASRSFYSLTEHLNLSEGDYVVGYKVFYRAKSTGLLYPTEGQGVFMTAGKAERGEIQPYLEDAPNTFVSHEGASRGFYFWPTREQAESYTDDVLIHSRGYMYGTMFDEYQDAPGTLEIHKVEGLYKPNKEGDIGDTMSEMLIKDAVVCVTHKEVFGK